MKKSEEIKELKLKLSIVNVSNEKNYENYCNQIRKSNELQKTIDKLERKIDKYKRKIAAHNVKSAIFDEMYKDAINDKEAYKLLVEELENDNTILVQEVQMMREQTEQGVIWTTNET